MAEHTKGPWKAIKSIPQEGFDCFWIKAQPSPALRGFTKWVATVATEADARLIAETPAMLEALRLCEQSLACNLCPGNIEDTGESCLRREDCGCDIGPALKATRAVIAAATGEEGEKNAERT